MATCTTCNGTGDDGIGLIYKRCGSCNGTGKMTRVFTYKEALTLCEHTMRAGYSLGKQNKTLKDEDITSRCKNIIGEP